MFPEGFKQYASVKWGGGLNVDNFIEMHYKNDEILKMHSNDKQIVDILHDDAARCSYIGFTPVAASVDSNARTNVRCHKSTARKAGE